MTLSLVFLCASAPPAAAVDASAKPRARDLGIPFDGTPGKWMAFLKKYEKNDEAFSERGKYVFIRPVKVPGP